MKKSITLLFCLLLSLSIQAQFSFSYNFGYGSFCMKDARDNLEKSRLEVVNILGIDMKTVDDFPGNLTHSIEFAYRFNSLEAGIQSSLFSTGGKISYSDYSGKMNESMLMRGFRQAVFLRFYPFKLMEKGASKIETFVEVSPGAIFTQFSDKVELQILSGDVVSERIKKNCTSFTVTPSIGIQYAINSNWKLNLKGGYEIEAYTGYLDFSDLGINEYIDTNWGGLRVNAGIAFYFQF